MPSPPLTFNRSRDTLALDKYAANNAFLADLNGERSLARQKASPRLYGKSLAAVTHLALVMAKKDTMVQ
jgi:hypothetical protein